MTNSPKTDTSESLHNTISCNFPERRKRAFKIHAARKNTTMGKSAADIINAAIGNELDAIERELEIHGAQE